MAKLTPADINTIVTMYKDGYTQTEIAKRFNTSQALVRYHLHSRGLLKEKRNKLDRRGYIQFLQKRANATQQGIEFSVLFEDIVFPDRCPIFDSVLDYSQTTGRGPSDNKPSFDRIDPTKGYIKGNVVIVSCLANRIKTDAHWSQILKVGTFYKELENNA